MVKAEMQAKVGIDDSYSISYSIVEGVQAEGGDDMVTVLATACPTEVIDSYKRVFSMLGISLKSVIIGCNCITKVLLSDEKNRSRMPLLAVQIDGSFISLNIYENNQLSFSRFASIDAADYDNSADYVYEAVNENIFRMLQFHRSRNAGNPIRNVILYGDTKDYMRISKDLEQMDINTSVISVPKNVKGYQNLEFALYANAIGAMFPRNKVTEKINLLEFGGTTGMISDKVKSDSSYPIILAVSVLVPTILLGAFTGILAIKDASLKKDISEMNAYLEDPQTKADLDKRLKRLELQTQVMEYQRTATLASDALKTRPYIESAVYNKVEEIVSVTVEQVKAGVPDLKYDSKNTVGNNFTINKFDYENGVVTFEYSMPYGTEPAPLFPAAFVENLQKEEMFSAVQYNGYTVGDAQVTSFVGSTPESAAVIVDQKEEKTVSSSITISIKSPVNGFDELASSETVEEAETGTEE